MTYWGFHCLFVGCLLLTTGMLQQSIFYRTTPQAGYVFVMWCNKHAVLSKTEAYKISTGESLDEISDLKIYRATAWDKGDVLIAHYKANTPGGIDKFSKHVPEGRKWTFEIYGDKPGLAELGLKWNFYDIRCEDTGNYTCEVQYYIKSGSSVVGINVTENMVTEAPTETCQRLIVSSTTISPGNRFLVYCDDGYMLSKTKTYKNSTGESLYDVSDLKIYRATAEDTGDVLIAHYKANTARGIARISKNIPEGRNWDVSNWADNNCIKNKDTMKLVLTISDTRCEDAGNYICEVQYYIDSARSVVGFNVTANVVTEGTCQRSIVSPTTITPGNRFLVYCDNSFMSSKTTAYKSNSKERLNAVAHLKIFRATAQDTRDVLIVHYEGGTSELYTHFPEGRKWGFSHYGDYNSEYNKDSMKLYLIVYDPRCEDAGKYTCEVQYYIDSYRRQVGFNVTENVVAVDACVNQIVWPKPMERSKPVKIYCDASRFHVPENDIFIVSILTIYIDLGMKKNNVQAAQYVSGHLPNAHEGIPPRKPGLWSQIKTPGRIYEFKFSGADSVAGANKNMSIEWTIPEAENEDVGTYTCDMEYFTKEHKLMKLSRSEFAYFDRFHALSPVYIPPLPTPPIKLGDLPPVLSVDRSNVPGYFNITCDAKRVRFPAEHINAIGILETRITIAFDNVQQSGEVWTNVCDIIHSGRKWEVIKGDYRDNYSNLDTASTKVIVHDPSCDDAGTYRCDIVYRDPQSKDSFHKVTEKQHLAQPCVPKK